MTEPSVLLQRDPRGVVTVTLNRPQVHNAFDEHLIAALTQHLRELGRDTRVRAVVLTGQGRSFSAGADLHWMRRMAGFSEAENLRDAMGLAELMRTLRGLPCPTIARVQGAAIGGGVGLVACCDIALAASEAVFAFSEVRLGIIPAVISPYVMAAIGERAARRYFLTAERFDASEAARLGLVHEVCPADALDARIEALIEPLLRGGPQALARCKELIARVAGQPLEDGLLEETARRIASARVSVEGQEGMRAFLDKRDPAWLNRASDDV
jgi:methylglutaconyl-CoA hydratase